MVAHAYLAVTAQAKKGGHHDRPEYSNISLAEARRLLAHLITRRPSRDHIHQPFSSWEGSVLLDVLQHGDGCEHGCGPGGAAAQLGQDLPALECGRGAFAEGSVAGQAEVGGFLVG